MRYDYEDLEIAILSTDGGFAARVVRSPLTEDPSVVFPRPLSDAELKAVLTRRLAAGGEALSPRSVGDRLFNAIFADDVGAHLRKLRAWLEGRSADSGGNGTRPGLRLRLRFGLDDPQREYLAALPWELLRDAEGGFTVATEVATPLVRDLSTRRRGKARRTLKVEGPLRILVVDAAPRDAHALNLQLELERMQVALKDLMAGGDVELLRPESPTLRGLRQALREETVHVLHFMGHGGYAGDTGYGALTFETPSGPDERGTKHQVDAEDFADHLVGTPTLRLVFLTACKSARYGGEPGSPYHGVAARAMERAGIPAVIANQHAISDEAAIAMSSIFYEQLAAGWDIDTALTETRLQMKPTSDEWATPVLFLSAPDGKLFEVEGGAKPRTGVTVIGDAHDEPKPFHVGIRSFLGKQGQTWGGDLETEADLYVDLTEHFDPNSPDGRYIRDPAQWQEQIYPELRTRLLEAVEKRRPLLLELAAHATIAFASGYLLESKSGLDIRIRQRTGNSVLDWRPDDGRLPDEETLWQPREDVVLTPDAPDIAVAAGISNPVLDEVKQFIEERGLPVGRIVDATIAPQPDQRSVAGGEHALRLAQKLVPRARVRRPAERQGRIHLFLSGPNAFAFYLGQLSGALGAITFYEYPFRHPRSHGQYRKSLELPAPDEIYDLSNF